MSSGFFGFFAHAGVLTALEERALAPSHVCGSSAGALVAGLWASGLPTADIVDGLLRLERSQFWDPSPGLGLLRGRKFRALLDSVLPVSSFAATRVPLAISVFDVLAREVRVLRTGELAPAIQASCAMPVLFQPVWIAGRPYIDGGVTDRPGIAGLPAHGRALYHHLSSKSPWRVTVPKPTASARMHVLEIAAMPRVGPFTLPRGRDAFEHARDHARRLLDDAHAHASS
jgi:NTE family protein|nr:patatin-like phospholipase family protein [Kofleriaceae bacterium]